MLKRVGVLTLMLAGAMAFLQPAAAFAQERYERGRAHNSVERREVFRQDRDHRDWNRGVRYYYAPAQNCGPYGY